MVLSTRSPAASRSDRRPPSSARRHGSVRVHGPRCLELDFRGTLGVDRQTPVGFSAIALRFDLDAPDASEEQIATLVKLTERYCVVLQTLRSVPDLSVSTA
ncbi:hypothetical protein BH20ACT16_BH20ACT16_00520 [soil metagenome]